MPALIAGGEKLESASISMTRRLVAIIFLVLGLPPFSSGQDDHSRIREMERRRFQLMEERFQSRMAQTSESSFDVSYYRIHLQIDPSPSEEILWGDVTMKAVSTVQDLREIQLDLYDNMAVDSVVSKGASLTYTHANNELTVTLPRGYDAGERLDVTVFYRGHPVDAGGIRSFTFENHSGVPVISTLSEPFGSPAWWPCKDDPADKADSVDIIITVPDTLVVASNGILVNEVRNDDGTRTFFWAERYPISTYLVSLAITNYEVFSDYYHYTKSDSMEVQFFVYPEHLAKAKEDFSVTVPMIEHFSSVFGEYPFVNEKYGMASFPWGGAMEHQTCTSYGWRLIRGNHLYDWVVAHELAHQWFGDLITMKRWSHIWLNEGFATYAEALWKERIKGEEAYLEYMHNLGSEFFPTSVFVRDSTTIASLFSRVVYDKGAWVLHMLRYVMGDLNFFRALREYRKTYAFGNATTEDFQSICESYYGAGLDWYFHEWVYGRTRPAYQYSWTDSTAGTDHVITLTLNQVQTDTGLYKMPLDVLFVMPSETKTVVVWDSLRTQTFEFVMPEEVTGVDIDPDGWVLKTFRQGVAVHDEGNQPRSFRLSQNYPNPFNGSTAIKYELPGQSPVTIQVYDLRGKRVRTLINTRQDKGRKSVIWDGTDEFGKPVSSGVYLYKIQAGHFASAKKMLLLK
ncbi:MAG: M1 family aminopeptidase [Fidelibacterota bacterium]